MWALRACTIFQPSTSAITNTIIITNSKRSSQLFLVLIPSHMNVREAIAKFSTNRFTESATAQQTTVDLVNAVAPASSPACGPPQRADL